MSKGQFVLLSNICDRLDSDRKAQLSDKFGAELYRYTLGLFHSKHLGDSRVYTFKNSRKAKKSGRTLKIIRK
ncbi:hypothetical protein VINI7043_22457 [Vibrio nigripulchritudo ATCC 27043]|nr:hypothetical protein VINI7043_22457 [Vibrio nigripulchritudo ATCC 27043]KJY76907.1 hypothetical protein TW74_13980 [Vibrio nigripulchritudo]